MTAVLTRDQADLLAAYGWQTADMLLDPEEGISAALTDKKNDVAIPDEDHFIEFDNKPGKDFLCVLYSKTALNINEIISKIATQQGDSFSKKVFAVIGNQMVEPKNIQFSTNNISFTGFSRGKSIVAMMVELEHK
jgi:hypothetical protein